MRKITRREVIALGGGAAIGVVAGSVGIIAVVGARDRPTLAPSRQPRLTADSWISTREAPYYIGHRGAGDVAPEHTLISYQTALQQGAQALEISCVSSSDGVLYCLHDLSLNRTTTMTGLASDHSAAQLDRARVRVPRLGPAWAGPNMPPMPRLQTVLESVGGKAVLCLESKNDAAYPAMIKQIQQAGLDDTVIVKADWSSNRLKEAKSAGYPVMAYLGNQEAATTSAIKTLAVRLDAERDALVLPARVKSDMFDLGLISRAANTGVPTWVFPVHRRYEKQVFTRLGVAGLVTPDVGYLSGQLPPLTADTWHNGAISPGELTRDPYANAFALGWDVADGIALAAQDKQAFVTLGQFSPIAAQSYRMVFDLCFDPLPTDTWQHASVAFGQADDRYYEHRLGDSDGYHVLLRADGTMAVYAHVQGDPNGQLLAQKKSTGAMKPGLWSRMTLDVSPDTITWSRDDGTVLSVKDGRFRGGYFHIGRSSNDGRLLLRALSIT